MRDAEYDVGGWDGRQETKRKKTRNPLNQSTYTAAFIS